MNLSIINRCNMNCSFCFQQDYMEEPKEVMSMEAFKKIIDWCNVPTVGLLGGEPTIHPNFVEMCEYAISKRKQLRLMSNFALDNDDVMDYVFSIERHIAGLLVNANCHTGKAFHKNVEKLMDTKKLYFSLGYTVNSDPSTSVEDYKNIIKYVQQDRDNKRKQIANLRLSFDTGALSNRTWKFEPEVTKKKFLDILKLIKENCRPDMEINLDCSINACYLDLDTVTEAEHMFPKMAYRKACGAPCDILADGKTASMCSNFILQKDSPYFIDDIFEFPDFVGIVDYMQYQLKNQQKCKSCIDCDSAFMCKGFCPALQEYFIREEKREQSGLKMIK